MIAGIYTRGEPVSNEQFRGSTERHNKMVGVNFIPGLAMCICCGKRKTAITGKFSRTGKFVCHGCGRARAMSAA